MALTVSVSSFSIIQSMQTTKPVIIITFAYVLFLLDFNQVHAASVGILDYVIPIPNLFNGSTDNGTIASCIPTTEGDRLECFDFNMNTQRLVDGDTGPLHSLSSTNLHRFLAWNRTQTQPVTLRFGFSPAVSSLSSVVLYFFNYPTQWISLPSVTLRGSTSARGTPFFETSYVYDFNDVQMNSDSQLRNLSLSITSNTTNIELLFIDLVFTNTDIDWILLSEVNICEGPPNANPVFEPVTFQGGQSETVTLGPNSPQSSVRLSCSVTVSGSFQWTWQHNGDSLLSSKRYQILTGDATRSSILVINKLNYTDEGTYSCVVNHVSQTERSLQNITLQLLVDINAAAKQISVREGEAVSVSCETYGYLRGKIEWVKDGQQVQSGGRYSITVRAGSRKGQDGGESSVSSVISQLTIQQVEEGDEGTYTCTAVETTLQERIYVNITTVNITTVNITTVGGTTTDFPVSNGSLPSMILLLVFVTVIMIVIIVVIAVSSVIVIVICYKKKTKKKQPEYDYVKNYSLPPNHNTRDTATTTDNPAYGMSTRAGIATTNNPAYEIHFVSNPTQASDYLTPVGKNPGGEPSDYLSPVELMLPNTSGIYEDIPQ